MKNYTWCDAMIAAIWIRCTIISDVPSVSHSELADRPDGGDAIFAGIVLTVSRLPTKPSLQHSGDRGQARTGRLSAHRNRNPGPKRRGDGLAALSLEPLSECQRKRLLVCRSKALPLSLRRRSDCFQSILGTDPARGGHRELRQRIESGSNCAARSIR